MLLPGSQRGLTDGAVEVHEVHRLVQEGELVSTQGQLPDLGRRLEPEIVERIYLGQRGVLADEDDEEETAAEKIDAADESEDELGGGHALRGGDVLVVPVHQVVDALEDPEEAHNNE